MKYELIGKNDYFLKPIDCILHNRGIVNVQSFLDVNESSVIHWSKLRNIERAVDCLLKHVENKTKIFIQYDSDVDGITSSSMLINYLKTVFSDVNIEWRIQEGKQHGVFVKTVPTDAKLVIIPDAGSNQYKEHKELRDMGMDVIVLDHHDCEEESKDAIVVNNQLSPEYENKNFSGAGIVYKFLKALDSKLSVNHADHYLDLVAVGNIGDMIDSRELETRYYMIKGLKKINNSFLKALIKKQDFSMGGIVNLINVAFYIVPLCNAAIRAGTKEEKEQMIRAFLESEEKIYYAKKDVDESIQVSTARLIGNIKNRQNRVRDKGVASIQERIEERNLLNNKVLIVNVTDILDKNLTGLVANQLVKLYKRPVLLVREKEGQKEDEPTLYGGSARGYEKGAIKDLKQFLTDTGKFVFCEGHPNAHGLEIEGEKLIEVNNLINEKLKDVEIDMDVHNVDFIIPANQLTDSLIKDLHKLRNIWGQKVDEPLLAIKGVSVNKDDVYLNGKKKNTIKFKYRGIEFVKFFTNEDTYNEIVSKGENLVFDIVGKASMNSWEGKDTPQVVIEDFEVVKTKKKQLLF
jgi:single-stranded-DNA-specific exonuclease